MITVDQIEKAQATWGNAIVTIGAFSVEEREEKTRALLLELYDFGANGDQTILFKPTKAAVVPFRPGLEDALSYFITGIHSEDKGFALAPYNEVLFRDRRHIIAGDGQSATSMGHYYFRDVKGDYTKVEFSFGYRLVDGALKINLHHSSIPFQG